MCKRFFSGSMRKIYILGIFLICGLLLLSVDDCESMYLEELQMAQASGEHGSPAAVTTPAAATIPAATTPPAAPAPATTPAPAATVPAATTVPAAATPDATAPVATTTPAAPGTPAATTPQSNQSGTTPSGDAGSSATPVPTPSPEDNPGDSTGADYLKSIIGKEWKLTELRLSGKSVVLDRNKLSAEGAGDFFTLTIDKSRLSGKAAPNRYTTAYQAGANNSLTLLPVISTLMATGNDPERLHEKEYYQYLGRVKSWKLNQKSLELNTTDANNKDAVLVYN